MEEEDKKEEEEKGDEEEEVWSYTGTLHPIIHDINFASLSFCFSVSVCLYLSYSNHLCVCHHLHRLKSIRRK